MADMDAIRSAADPWLEHWQATQAEADEFYRSIEFALRHENEVIDRAPVVLCGEPVPFRDPEGQYECVLTEEHEGTHKTRLFNDDRQKWITYRWTSTDEA